MPSTITVGTEIRLQATFKDESDSATNPATAPQIIVTEPDGTQSTYTSTTTPAFSAQGSGLYELQLLPTQTGRHWYYPYVPTTDANPVADESYFDVDAAKGTS